jgi:disulfide bond formation protein DsbB
MVQLQRILNLLFIYVLCGVLLAGLAYQLIMKENPCPLCLLQRLGMIGVASALLLNLRYGIKVQHYGLALLVSLVGRIIALRQICLHVCPQFPTFGHPVLGFDLYVWSYIVFTCSMFACALLLIIYGYTKEQPYLPKWNKFEKSALVLLILITIENFLHTLLKCGLTACP